MFVIIVIYAYLIDISQGSVETHLWCGGIYNNHIITNCLQSVPVNKFWKQSIIVEDMDKSKVACFWSTLYIQFAGFLDARRVYSICLTWRFCKTFVPLFCLMHLPLFVKLTTFVILSVGQ